MATASIQLKLPEAFDFKQPDSWTRWKRRFEQFRVASGLDSEAEKKQISTLLYCLGEEAEIVLASTNISEDDRKKYEKVLSKLDEFFAVRKNVIFERARFNRRSQNEGESIEQFITALYHLIETCEYGELKNEMLRDRIVVGIRDTALSERLQMDASLTLDKAKKMVRQKEAVAAQGLQLRADGSKDSPIVVDATTSHKTGKTWKQRKNKPQGGFKTTQRALCTRCGNKHSKGDKCPAKSGTCHKCNRKGHFASQCFSKTVAETTTDEFSFDTVFVGTMRGAKEFSWNTSVNIGTTSVPFKLDTGAEATAISEQSYKKLSGVELQQPQKVLYGPSRQTLNVLGQFTATLSHRGIKTEQTIYVIRGLKLNLLGLPAIISLQLIYRVDKLGTADDIMKRFPKVFAGLGDMGGEYTVRLKEGATPHSIYTPRAVPLPLRDKVKSELQRMQDLGVISPVKDPTPWCAGMVVVPKRSGDIRICVDFRPLNQSVCREVHPIPKVDSTLSQLAGATVFSKLDANSGFWQIPLASESRHLTTFLTPFGRFCFNKLPFGISSAPEVFQRRMSEILEGLEGVVCQIDDVLVYGQDQAEHDARLTAVLERLEKVGTTLNPKKCEFRKPSVKFLGHVVDRNGIRADEEKTAAIREMDRPKNVSELRRFLGMANQLGKFSPNLAELTQPLRELLSTKRTWYWSGSQEEAFVKVKLELSQPTVLAPYNLKLPTKIAADASSYGLGAVLLQLNNGSWKPVAYASRAMSETEQRYAQIEKEGLAATWACERFAEYVLGLKFLIETDHKPLVPLLGTKNLDSLPPRVLRFRLRLARFDYTIEHVPGKLLYTADTLSRAPMENTLDSIQLDVEPFICGVVKNLPVSSTLTGTLQEEQDRDPICSKVKEYSRSGWPDKRKLSHELIPYWKARSTLSECDGLLLNGCRIVVPCSMRKRVLEKVHEGHQGVERCRARIRSAVWWPNASKDVEQMVQTCGTCVKNRDPKREPLITTPLPEYPWQHVATDLFELSGQHYLVVVDYFSRYPEVAKLSSTTSEAVISVLRSIFARYGIPEVVRSDNGPQYSSRLFADFAGSYGFKHETSSPRYPQSNGQAERTVKTVKQLISRSNDVQMALLSYRATPLPWCNLSPAELSMGRQLRTRIPQWKKCLVPDWSYLKEFQVQNAKFKEKQKTDYDKRHRVQDVCDIPDQTKVWVKTGKEQASGTVISKDDAPRSYLVDTPSGTQRRNRQHLTVIPKEKDQDLPQGVEHKETRIATRSQTGTVVKPPERLM